ncbi:FimD/PapC C-terminal domain-containing protein [Klebsiella pneumoniae]
MARWRRCLKSEENASIVGDGGEVLLSGLPQKGTLQVKWGEWPGAGNHLSGGLYSP